MAEELEARISKLKTLGSFTIVKAIPEEWWHDTIIARCYVEIELKIKLRRSIYSL